MPCFLFGVDIDVDAVDVNGAMIAGVERRVSLEHSQLMVLLVLLHQLDAQIHERWLFSLDSPSELVREPFGVTLRQVYVRGNHLNILILADCG